MVALDLKKSILKWGALAVLIGWHFLRFSIAPGVPWVLLTTLETSMIIGELVTLAPCALSVKVKAVPRRDWWGYHFAVPKGCARTPSPTVGFSLEVGPQHEPWAMGILTLLPEPNVIKIPVLCTIIQRSLDHDDLDMAAISEESLDVIRMFLDVNPINMLNAIHHSCVVRVLCFLAVTGSILGWTL